MKLLLYIILVINTVCFSQSITLIEKKELNVDAFIGIDSYNQQYTVHQNVLYKKGTLGNFEFQDIKLGKIETVDIINPLNIVVFYKDVSTVVFLDNRLNERERIVFNELPAFLNVSHVNNAGNNRLWIFNVDNQQLELFHYRSLQETIVSQPYSGKIISVSSNFMTCSILTEEYLRKVNIYGSLLFEISTQGFTHILEWEDQTLGFKDQTLYFITKEKISPFEKLLIENPVKQLQLTQDLLYIYDGKTLITYKINPTIKQ